MAGESVSFRITRTTEDLAQTVAALSQRLVKLEQRFGALELQIAVQEGRRPPPPPEIDLQAVTVAGGAVCMPSPSLTRTTCVAWIMWPASWPIAAAC